MDEARAAADALVGAEVGGKYRLERVVGLGGMGAVYQATHREIGKRVALKFLDPAACRDQEAVLRFQREAQAASAVESAHIVQIFDVGTFEGRPYLVMEYLSGEDLRSLMNRERVLEPAVAVAIAGQVLRALARAHEAGIVHRDLKPENVFLCARDDDPRFVKVVDFGISKVSRSGDLDAITRRGVVMGTAFYMAPEQAQSAPDVDGRADLYGVGAILFEMLSGRPPHEGRSYEAVLIEACTRDAPELAAVAPSVPPALSRVVARALRRSREERPGSAQELYGLLVEACPGALPPWVPTGGASLPPRSREGHETGAVGPVTRSSRLASTHARRTLVAVVVAALGAFAVTVWLTRGSREADRSRDEIARHAVPPLEPASAPPASSVAGPSLPVAPGIVAEPPPHGSSAGAPSPGPSASAVRAGTSKHLPSSRPAAQRPRRPGVAGGLELVTDPGP